MKKCVNCGNDTFAPTTESRIYPIGGIKYEVRTAGRRCTRCGEIYFAARDVLRGDLAVAARIPQFGPREGKGFRFMRKAIGIQANELALLLQRTPETISRWENGKAEIEPMAWVLLDVMVHDKYEVEIHDARLPRRLSREVLEMLRTRPPKRPKGGVIDVELAGAG